MRRLTFVAVLHHRDDGRLVTLGDHTRRNEALLESDGLSVLEVDETGSRVANTVKTVIGVVRFAGCST